MEGPVTWSQLYLIVGLTIGANVSLALFVGVMVYRVCDVYRKLDIRLIELEMTKKPKA